MTEDLPMLPALRSLGNLAGLRPILVTDTREQLPLPFKRLASVRDTLTSGDYSFWVLQNDPIDWLDIYSPLSLFSNRRDNFENFTLHSVRHGVTIQIESALNDRPQSAFGVENRRASGQRHPTNV